MSQMRWKFDIQIDEPDEQYCSISELIRMGDEALAAGKYDNAFRIYSRAESSSAGKHRLANIYIQIPDINCMTQAQRFLAAEKLLLTISEESRDACLDLAALYLDKLNRVVAALAFLLRARALGANIDPSVIDRCQKHISKSDICNVENHPQDCFALACAMVKCAYGGGKFLEYLLRIAAEAEDAYSGSAALMLANMYDENKDIASARKYYGLASKLGNPPILRRHYR